MSSSVIGSLRVNLGLDSAQFARGARGVEAPLKRMRKQFLAVSGVAAALAGSLTALTIAASKTAAEIKTFSQIANAAPEELQKWAAGSKSVGIEQEKLADILKDVNDRVGDFLTTGGGPMADFFENVAPKIGITADAFRDLSGPQALQLYVTSLEKAGLSQQEMTFYLEAMASDTTALIPLLRNGGAEMARLGENARTLGGIMSASTVVSLTGLRAALSDTGMAMQGIGYRISGELAPALTALATGFNDAMREGGVLRGVIGGLVGNLDVMISTMGVAVTVFGVRYVGALVAAKVATLTFAGSLAFLKRALIATGIGALIVGAGFLVAKFGDVVTATGGLGAAFGLLGDVGAEVWKRIGYTMQAFKSRFVADFLGIKATALDGWQAILDGSYSMADGLIGVAVGAKDAFVAAWETLPAAFANIGARAINSMAEMIKSGANALLSPLNAILEAAGMDSISANWGSPVNVPAAPNVGAAVSGAFSAATSRSYIGAAPQTAGATADALRGIASSRDATADVWAGLASAPLTSLEALRAAASAVGDTVATANPSLTEFGDALADIGGGGDAGGGGAGGAGAALDTLKGKVSSLKDSANAMKDTFKGAFKGIVTGAMSLKDAVISVLNKIADKLLDSAFDALWGGGKGGLLGGLFKGLFSADGNVFSGGSHVKAYANGGVVNGPTAFPIRGGNTGLMGEAGPEAIMPLTRIGGKLGVQTTGGCGAISVVVRMEQNGELGAFVESKSGPVAVKVMKAGLQRYSTHAAPSIHQQIALDPRKKF